MSGRDKFRRHARFLAGLTYVISLAPSLFRKILWDHFSSYSGVASVALRYCLVKAEAAALGNALYVGRFVVLKNLNEVVLGSNVSIHEFCYIDGAGGLVVGDNVSIAHGCSIITFNHTVGDADVPIKYAPVSYSNVVIESDVWLGCGVRVMPGVRIGSRSIVAAGSVVTSNVPPGSVVAGVPARIIKKLVGENEG
ncbi:hypothetical protein MFKK_33440 [Halopseudomonas aestusnigri]|uniref:acyltransferase n=1 Tax=Halopseudomonas TaxID=2901189 RepID=UPI0022B70290|nr:MULTISPECIES: acyltransferase [Halopseudomonas]BDX20534.1 hypothetical protein MFKK_33440 [Halopseudomonas aestusnigri]